jgi:opacity protein-like surface antigen
MKKTMLLAALTLTLIASFSAQAADTTTAVPTEVSKTIPAVVQTIDLDKVTNEISPEMVAVLKQIKVQAIAQVNSDPKALKAGAGYRSGSDFKLDNSFRLSSKRFTMTALKGGGYEVTDSGNGVGQRKIKVSLTIRCCPGSATLTVSW